MASLSLVEAVTAAIASLPTDDMKRRFAESILLAGGVARTRGLIEALEDELFEFLPQRQPVINAVEVLQPPKIRGSFGHSHDDAQWLGWKGASMLLVSEPASSYASRELWVDRTEWMLHGARILRERLPYLW